MGANFEAEIVEGVDLLPNQRRQPCRAAGRPQRIAAYRRFADDLAQQPEIALIGFEIHGGEAAAIIFGRGH